MVVSKITIKLCFIAGFILCSMVLQKSGLQAATCPSRQQSFLNDEEPDDETDSDSDQNCVCQHTHQHYHVQLALNDPTATTDNEPTIDILPTIMNTRSNLKEIGTEDSTWDAEFSTRDDHSQSKKLKTKTKTPLRNTVDKNIEDNTGTDGYSNGGEHIDFKTGETGYTNVNKQKGMAAGEYGYERMDQEDNGKEEGEEEEVDKDKVGRVKNVLKGRSGKVKGTYMNEYANDGKDRDNYNDELETVPDKKEVDEGKVETGKGLLKNRLVKDKGTYVDKYINGKVVDDDTQLEVKYNLDEEEEFQGKSQVKSRNKSKNKGQLSNMQNINNDFIEDDGDYVKQVYVDERQGITGKSKVRGGDRLSKAKVTYYANGNRNDEIVGQDELGDGHIKDKIHQVRTNARGRLSKGSVRFLDEGLVEDQNGEAEVVDENIDNRDFEQDVIDDHPLKNLDDIGGNEYDEVNIHDTYDAVDEELPLGREGVAHADNEQLPEYDYGVLGAGGRDTTTTTIDSQYHVGKQGQGKLSNSPSHPSPGDMGGYYGYGTYNTQQKYNRPTKIHHQVQEEDGVPRESYYDVLDEVKEDYDHVNSQNDLLNNNMHPQRPSNLNIREDQYNDARAPNSPINKSKVTMWPCLEVKNRVLPLCQAFPCQLTRPKYAKVIIS